MPDGVRGRRDFESTPQADLGLRRFYVHSSRNDSGREDHQVFTGRPPTPAMGQLQPPFLPVEEPELETEKKPDGTIDPLWVHHLIRDTMFLDAAIQRDPTS